MYREIALNCFRYLDFKSFAEVDRLTIPEYTLLMQAVRLKQVDMDYRSHLLAWLTFSAKATKKKGKPVYNKFSKFYSYEKEIKKAMKKGDEPSKLSGLSKFLRRESEEK